MESDSRRGRGVVGALPIVIFYVALFVAPVVAFLSTSVRETAGMARLGDGPTATQYESILASGHFLSLIVNTVVLALAAAILTVVIAYPIAYQVARSSTRWSVLIFNLVIASMFTSSIVGALGLRVLLSEVGPVNLLFSALGWGVRLEIANSQAAVVIGMVQAMTPIAVVALVPVCGGFSQRLIEAASGLGASQWLVFWRIVFPLTRLGILGVGLLSVAVGAGLFVTPLLLGGGRVALLSIEIRQQILSLLDFPLGAAFSTLLVGIVSAITVVSLILGRRYAVRGGSL